MVILNSKYVNNIMATINKELCLYGVFQVFPTLSQYQLGDLKTNE